MLNRALFTSERNDWETPEDLFKQLDAEFGFDIDVCATAETTKCRHFFSPDQDGLKQRWRGVCWMNSPYGSALPTWIAKAYTASVEGATVVCLVPARTDTRWWHDFAMRGEIRLIRGRLRFGQAQSGAPFPSAIIVFKPKRYLSCASRAVPHG
jgi:phage N-6-adenine-methyltransferase